MAADAGAPRQARDQSEAGLRRVATSRCVISALKPVSRKQIRVLPHRAQWMATVFSTAVVVNFQRGASIRYFMEHVA